MTEDIGIKKGLTINCQPFYKYAMINLEASKTLLTFVLQRYLKLCRAMQCVAETSNYYIVTCNLL